MRGGQRGPAALLQPARPHGAAPDRLRLGEFIYFAFDVLFSRARDLRSLPLVDRKRVLREALEPAGAHVFDRLRFVTALPNGDPRALLSSACAMQLEGIVSKRLDAPYRSGERNETWLKAKCRPSQEVVIGGWRFAGSAFKGLLAGVWEDDGLVYVGSVQTGFSGRVLDSLAPKLRAVRATSSPFSGEQPGRHGFDIHWTRPELVASVDFAEWTGSGKLRQSSFKGLREDKLATEVFREGAER